MTHNRFFNRGLICALILVTGLGLALALPWLASSQGLAAQSEVGAQGSFMRLYIQENGLRDSSAKDTKLTLDSSNFPEATRYYVSKTGNGTDGQSWAKAFPKLQDALSTASSDDEIWVATGVYTPGSNQTDSFNLVPGAALYGGFAATETVRTERDWEANPTILSGDIDGDDTHTGGVVLTTTNIVGGNSYHVLWADGTTSTPITGSTIVDGFTITAGKADGSFPHNYGGGFYCDGLGNGIKCSPSLRNITFSGNSADEGGALYNNGYDDGDSSPSLNDVTFSGNSADYGGAIFNNGREGSSSPSLMEISFTGNSADYGGAVYNNGYHGTSSPSITNVTFINNSALAGGAMFNNGEDSGTSNPSLKEVTFTGSMAQSRGGAMYNHSGNGNCSPSLRDVIFSNNSAVTAGGAIYNYGENGSSSPSLINVTFSGNASVFGGAMYNDGDNGTSSPTLINVVFSGNIAGYGGALYNDGYSGTSKSNLTNVTFSSNMAVVDGGAMYNAGGSGGNCSPQVRNSILWNNKDKSGTGKLSATIYNDNATITLTHSLAQGTGGSSSWIGGSYVDGGGNIDEDPMFVTPIDPSTAPTTAGNLRLQTSSPAIDAGDNIFAAGVLTDLDGEPRIVDRDGDGTAIVDMGAYENQNYYYLPLINR
ncbi:MAG: choice-of-anchor Q domain-containing protein [Anaerolineales bacterium]